MVALMSTIKNVIKKPIVTAVAVTVNDHKEVKS